MSAPAAIRGTFSDFRLVKSRSVAQLVVEIKIEEADAALATLGGLPQPASERWVALAALNVTSIKPKERQRWADLKAAAQAGTRCGEPAFQKFLQSINYEVRNSDEAAEAVRHYCNVDSRRQLNLDPVAADAWRELERAFQVWMKAPQHA